MGLLDEAIRQHLELKRQHGASDEELHMQEQEALGPVRREPAEPPAATSEDAVASHEQTLDEDAEYLDDEPPMEAGPDAPFYEEAPAEPVGEALAPPDAALTEPIERFHEPIDPYGEPEPGEADDAMEAPIREHDLESGPSGDTPTSGFESVPSGDTPTSGFEAVQEPVPEDALDDQDEEAEEDDDDVLEETPEFLQETPEHDRLWFEQRPPRDFDFDE